MKTYRRREIEEMLDGKTGFHRFVFDLITTDVPVSIIFAVSEYGVIRKGNLVRSRATERQWQILKRMTCKHNWYTQKPLCKKYPFLCQRG